MHNSFSHGASPSPKQPKHDRWRYLSVSAALWIWLDLVYPRSPTGRPYPARGPGRTGGTRVTPPLCGNGWTLCILVLPRGVPIPQGAQAGPEGLECILRCVGVAGPGVLSFSHRVSLSPKRPTQDRGDSGVSPALWEWLAPAYLILPQGVPIFQVAQAGTEELTCLHRYVGMPGPCVSWLSHGASLSPKRPRQDLRDSGVSALKWELLDLVRPRSAMARPYPPRGPRSSGGTRVYPPLCGSVWTLCILVLPRGVPIPQAAQVGAEGLRCIRRYLGVAGPCVSSFSHGASLSPKRLR